MTEQPPPVYRYFSREEVRTLWYSVDEAPVLVYQDKGGARRRLAPQEAIVNLFSGGALSVYVLGPAILKDGLPGERRGQVTYGSDGSDHTFLDEAPQWVREMLVDAAARLSEPWKD